MQASKRTSLVGVAALRERALRYGLWIAIALGALIGALDLAAPLDRRLLDAGFALMRHTAPAPVPTLALPDRAGVPREIVVVGIDEETLAAFPEPLTLWHRHLGDFLAVAADAGARAIGVDLVLPDRSYAAISPDYDRALIDGLLAARRTVPLILAVTIGNDGAPRPVHAPFLAIAGAQAAGFALWRADPDGVVRRFDERLGEGGEAVPTFVGQLARALGVEPAPGLIHYGIGPSWTYLPLRALLDGAGEEAKARARAALADRVVVLGTVLPFEDRLRVPVALASASPATTAVTAAWSATTEAGVLVHAQTLRGILAGRLVQPLPAWAAALLCATAALAWAIARTPARAALVVAGLVVVVSVVAYRALASDLALPLAALLASGGIAALGRLGVETAFAWRERRRLRSAFSGYVSPQVMAEIESGNLEGLASARRFLCVLIMDVRNFTPRSEGMPAEKVVELINKVCEEATAAVHDHRGTVDKFMGDGVMAFFGAPTPIDEPCEAAFAAARDLLERIRRISDEETWAGEPPVAIGIGLNCGEAIVGHVGAATRHSYTAIGDCVNVASRLESLTKELGFPVVMSKDVALRLSRHDGLMPLGPQSIKGHSAVEVYGWSPQSRE